MCVLGHNVRKQLFADRGDIVGRTVRVNGYPYQVIGAMAEKEQNSSYDGWDNDKIFDSGALPQTRRAAQRRDPRARAA